MLLNFAKFKLDKSLFIILVLILSSDSDSVKRFSEKAAGNRLKRRLKNHSMTTATLSHDPTENLV